MEQMIRFNDVGSRFQDTLSAAIEDFRSGNDSHGLDELLAAAEDLEMILEKHWRSELEDFKPGQFLPILEKLSALIKNKDIVGMTDLLEFTLYPMAKELAEDD